MRVHDVGTVPYLEAWRLQEALATRLRAGEGESVLLLEHPHVFTVGRRGTLDHLTASPRELRRLGAQLYRVDRGGDITYHGPGQLVAYPIVDLEARGGDLVAYVRALEDAFIATARHFGVAARRIVERTGVWAPIPGVASRPGAPAPAPGKLAAIGVRVSRGVTTHGVAMNVATDLAWFARMVPCGFVHEPTSFARLGVRASVAEVKPVVVAALGEALGARMEDAGMPAPPREDEIAPDAPVRAAVDLLADAVSA